MRRILTIFILLLVILTGSLYIRTIVEAKHWLATAKQELELKHHLASIPHLRRAVAWRSPGNESAQEAKEILENIAFDPALSVHIRLQALEELKRGILSSRSFLNQAEDADSLTKLRPELDRLSETNPADFIKDSKRPEINYFYQILTQLFFWAWISAALIGIWRGFNQHGALIIKPLATWIGCAILAFTAWLACLSLA